MGLRSVASNKQTLTRDDAAAAFDVAPSLNYFLIQRY
jgi:hypothetical protein